MSTDRDAQVWKEGPNQLELKGKSKAELKNTKGNIRKFNKKNNNRYRINTKKNTYLIITIILFNFMIPKNMIEFNQNITLKIRGPGFSDVLGPTDLFYSIYHPNCTYINGIRNNTITNRYYFNNINNTVKLIWDNSITKCSGMFKGCSNITEIDLSNFDTSKVEVMTSMFKECTQLTSINLSNVNTSKVTSMNSMFYKCTQLTSLDLSTFKTSSVTNMNAMFAHCSQLSSLNLSNFDTSKVTIMCIMFSECSKLTSLNLYNFNTERVTNMTSMFSGCKNLEYINLQNFKENSSLSINSSIFNKVPDNIVVCLNQNSNKILKEIKKINCYNLDCSDNWKIEQKKRVNKSNVCFDIFNNGISFKYEYQGKYYESCINRSLTNHSCQCDIKSFIDLKYDLYEIEENDNLNGYRKCYKNISGYYLDKNDNKFKKCYYSCKNCEMKGNNIEHNCLECDNNYPVEFKINNYSNRYQNRNFYYYFDINNNYKCTTNNKCPGEYPILNGTECKLDNRIKFIRDILALNCLNNVTTKEEEINCYDSILKQIEDIYTSKNYSTAYLEDRNDEIIEIKKLKVILTTNENQKKINNNTTNIDLGDCEQSLRRTYNLSNNTALYIKMLEISQEEMRIPKVEYNIYAKLNGENLQKLSLDSCQNNKISLLIPVNNSDNIDKLNSKSRYYNDFCYIATSDKGTDITLEDRKNEYPSKAVCQDECDFNEYNYTLQKAICSCKANESSLSFKDMKIDKKNY